ncbi:uncharacterized protein LOC135847021 [Planococcus citri]|uniref:uncharacterized protein LOC135847021 n=1 Tax=Planococcus citri TaxID=170843 RepID=UPI0031F88C4D
MKISLSFSFINEMNFYTKIAPALSTLDVTFLSMFPKFYHGEVTFNADGDQSTIIMENLKARGYRMSEKKAFLSYQHLNLMMRKLGQFHAYSYKAKKSIPNLFYPLAYNLLETHPDITKESFDILLISGERGLDDLRRDPKYVKYASRIHTMLENSNDIFERILTCDQTNSTSTIVHGDYLRNNVMFKYENNIPNDLIMIDMATLRYGSPVLDLASVLYINADQDTRDKHWDALIDAYYAALKDTFVENEIPSKNEILSEFIDKSFFVYLIASTFVMFLMAADNDDLPIDTNDGFHPETITREIAIECHLKLGGKPATQALSNILTDMIDRGFICQ